MHAIKLTSNKPQLMRHFCIRRSACRAVKPVHLCGNTAAQVIIKFSPQRTYVFLHGTDYSFGDRDVFQLNLLGSNDPTANSVLICGQDDHGRQIDAAK